MAYSDVNFCDTFSDKSNSSSSDNLANENEKQDTFENNSHSNIALQVLNRQIYGRFTKRCKAKTERVFKNIPSQCRISMSSLVKNIEYMHHVFMGFTICGTYFLSFTEKVVGPDQDILHMLCTSYEYELHLWKFQPGTELKYITRYKIFKQLQDSTNVLDNVMFMQFPLDPYKIICYGAVCSNTPMAYMTILTLPSKSCKHCSKNFSLKTEDVVSEGWCSKHGFILHYALPLSNPSPLFNPHISLAYPDYLVFNTGHYIHILNINTSNPPQASNNVPINLKEEDKLGINLNDTQSETSETISDHFETNSVVDAILEDFNEYDLESGECNKPFHELNISCEPLNVTGFDSDFDNDSRLIMKFNGSSQYSTFMGVSGGVPDGSKFNGLLIVDPVAKVNTPKWIKKVVRRYSNGDFENGSLLSGHSRDDYNIPIEIPLIAQTLSDQQLDIVPDFKLDHTTNVHLIVTQRTFDCEQFIQRKAQCLCTESQLQFLHCQDYDLKIVHVCPVEGDIVCKATIKIGALKNVSNCKPAIYCFELVFIWNIATDEFKLLCAPNEKLCSVKSFKPSPPLKFPRINCQKVLVLDYGFMSPKTVLRDYSGNYEIYLNGGDSLLLSTSSTVWSSEDSFYDSEGMNDFEENSL